MEKVSNLEEFRTKYIWLNYLFIKRDIGNIGFRGVILRNGRDLLFGLKNWILTVTLDYFLVRGSISNTG
jgi:hypothetical protein